MPKPKPADVLSAIVSACMSAYTVERTAESVFATTLQYDDKKQERAARARAARRRVKIDSLLDAIYLLQKHGPELEGVIARLSAPHKRPKDP